MQRGCAPLHAPMDGTSRGALRCAQDTPSAQSVIPAEGHALSWPRNLASQNRTINPLTPNLGGWRKRRGASPLCTPQGDLTPTEEREARDFSVLYLYQRCQL